MIARALVVVAVGVLVLAWAAPANAAPGALYGVQDDAWLVHGPGTLDSRLRVLDRMGVDVVRYTARWYDIAKTQPAAAGENADPAYDWSEPDAILEGLRRHGIRPVVTLYGTPRWANGGEGPNGAPTDTKAFGLFAGAAASRYPWVSYWTVWNEPNRPQWLRPTSARIYVQKLLNPAYEQIHAASPGARVGGGVTAPRAGTGGVSPVAWITAMGALRARLDAYAHHPYPSNPRAQTPWKPACTRCSSITMADLERLTALVRRNFGPKRIWLTEYGYQSNPPDTFLGVPLAKQAGYVASAARRAQLAPAVDMLVYFLVRDDATPEGWQSGFYDANGKEKPAYTAFRFPLVRVSRAGGVVRLWGQIRPRQGPQQYRLRLLADGRWSWIGGTRVTNVGGVLTVAVRAPRGARVQLLAVEERAFSLAIRV